MGQKVAQGDRARLIEGWLGWVNGDGSKLWAFVEFVKLADTEPNTALDLILEIAARHPEEKVLGQLEAGPLERLLTTNGRSMIDRIETVSTKHPVLRELLNGVYRIDVPQDVWERIVRISGRERQMKPQ